MKYFFLIIFMNGLLFGSPLDKISKEDQPKLELLFQSIMLDNYFAYTLFGEKPITFYGQFYAPYYESLFKPKIEDLFFRNWKVWKKYANQFPMKNFAFVENDYGASFGLFLVNKPSTLSLILKNKEVFDEYFKKSISAQEILDKIINAKNYFEVFGNNQIIYGLLFGYGYTNSLAFHLKSEKEHFFLEGVSFHDEPQHYLYLLPLPYFMVFHSNDEVFELRKKYESERKEIIAIYSKGNFLEITLEKLTSR